jgi:hypothetical protein
MDVAAPAAAGVAVLCLVIGTALGLALAGRRVRRSVAEARAEVEELRARVEQMADRLGAAATPAAASAVPPDGVATEYVITGLGTGTEPAAPVAVPDRAVLSVTFGEPLVKVVAFGYGVRRALSPESRNRIVFEMRRELKRARKERRRGTRQARREAAA